MAPVLIFTFLEVLSLKLSDAVPQITLIPGDAIYFSNGGDLSMTCTVDQDVKLNSVLFERDGITQIGIFEPESLSCSTHKFQNDSHNYTTVCYLERNFTLIKHDVNDEDHNKTWRCSMVSNAGGPCTSFTSCISHNTIAILQDAPIVKLQAEVRDINPFRLKEGHTNVVLMCEIVIAYPEIILFIWTHNEIEVQNESRSNLTIPVATRQTDGTWGCKGINNYGTPLESHLQIDVQYGPIIYPIGNKSTIEGKSFSVTCKVDANPLPYSLSWTKDNNETFHCNSSVLTINQVSRYDSGTYKCTANNLIHPSGHFEESLNDTEEFYLDVQYGAEIINVSVEWNSTLNENSIATIICQIDSNPESNINWTKQGVEGTLKANWSVHHSQLDLQNVQCTDTSNYTCRASNGLSDPVEQSIPIYVTCHPRTDFRSPPVTKVNSKPNGNAALIYTVISFPKPAFTWSFIGNGSENMPLPDSAKQRDKGLQSTLALNNLNINDFGFYKVEANNSFPPSASEVYELIPVDVPEVPSNVTVTDIKQASLIVQWIAGYDGGQNQTFHIMITTGDTTRSFDAPDPGNGKVGTYTLEDLMSNTMYSIYMSASNSLGPSNMTNVIFQTTLKGPSMSESIGIPFTWIVGTISSGLFGILIGVTGIVLWRRYHPKKSQHESDSHIMRDIRIERRDMKTDVVPNDTARVSEYEELNVIRAEANEYMQINESDSHVVRDIRIERRDMKTDVVPNDTARVSEYQELNVIRAEANEYMQINAITTENNTKTDVRSPGKELYETLHFDSIRDIQMHTMLKIKLNI